MDTTVPHIARVWNYWLGGKDNYEADRQAGERVKQAFPQITDIARADRAFLARAVAYLVEEAGIRQFLDIGTGLPTAGNTHEVAQSLAPEARVVYVDNDPLVLTHARALLTSSPAGATDYVEADARDPETILGAAARTLDFDRPVAVMMLGVLHYVPEYQRTLGVVRRLLEAVPGGSHLAITHATFDAALGGREGMEGNAEATEYWNRNAPMPIAHRAKELIAAYFDGLDLVDPGLVSMPLWRPETTPFGEPPPLFGYSGVGRKP
ncbi:SAM-dependent methyltransferase [Streptomyces sp. MAR4 CNX-425]|uniref:SAM-dependent methyltransferase n=1 Tax=Streptomyces sp. MAR4 CNX-425 TaxID=3406343 RepID=UPI003B515222